MTDDKDETPVSPDVHFEPVIRLPEVEVLTLEEEEEEILKLRARLYRYVANENPPEWKERGTGDVKLLRHSGKGTVRVLMRRDKTLKICANHYITPWMELKPNCGSDRAWVWSVAADFADEAPKEELLAIKFGNSENAKKFKDVFEECQKKILEEMPSDEDSSEEETDDVVEKLDKLKVEEVEEKEDTSKTEDGASPCEPTSTTTETTSPVKISVADSTTGGATGDATKAEQESTDEHK